MTYMATLLDNQYIFSFVSGVIGILLALGGQKILKKRGLFTYFTQHNKLGSSIHNNPIYGSVQVTWNNNPVNHLYLSTIELINKSSKDYESVTVCVFTDDTTFLAEETEIEGSIHFLGYTDKYSTQISVPEGGKPTEYQLSLYRGRREYLIPTMNRGQIVRFHYLNAASSEAAPSIWLDMLHPGVTLKFRVAPYTIYGVPQFDAARAGVVIGSMVVGLVIAYIDSLWLAAIITFLFGLFAQIPGAYMIKVYHKIKEWISG